MHHSIKWLVLGAIVVTTMTGCDWIKDLTGSSSRRSAGVSADDEGERDVPKVNVVISDDGITHLNPPSVLEQREGKAVSSKKLAADGARSAGPSDNWIYKTAKGAGSVLISAASQPNTIGGDMIRRIDLGSNIKEYDFNKKTEGVQGAYILVPDSMRGAVPSKYIDGDGLFSGTICGFVPGPNNTVIALAKGTEGGVAFLLNPYEQAQAFTPLEAIQMPFGTNTCRGVYSEALHKLYVVDVTRTGAKNGAEGVFVADIFSTEEPQTASFYVFGQDLRINSHSVNNFQAIELYDDKLYLLSGNGRFDSEWDNVIYRVPLNEFGEPLFENIKYTQTHNPVYMTAGCGINDSNISDLAVINTDKGPRLLSSGTASTIAWDISGDELKKVDLDEDRPGVQGLNIEKMGRGGVRMAFTPDGKELIQLPHCRSEKQVVKIDSGYDMFAFDLPVINIKDMSLGKTLDAGYRDVLMSLKNAAYRPQFTMEFGDMAVGTQHVVILGNSGSNISGLNAGSDVVIVDRAKGSNIGFAKPTDMRRAHELRYGFKLAQGAKGFEHTEQHSHAVIWIP